MTEKVGTIPNLGVKVDDFASDWGNILKADDYKKIGLKDNNKDGTIDAGDADTNHDGVVDQAEIAVFYGVIKNELHKTDAELSPAMQLVNSHYQKSYQELDAKQKELAAQAQQDTLDNVQKITDIYNQMNDKNTQVAQDAIKGYGSTVASAVQSASATANSLKSAIGGSSSSG